MINVAEMVYDKKQGELSEGRILYLNQKVLYCKHFQGITLKSWGYIYRN